MRKTNSLRSSLMILLLCLGLTSAWGQTETLNCPIGTIVDNTMTFETENFSIVHARGSDSNFASYSPWRVYTNNTVTFTGGEDVQNITSIVITTGSSSYASAVTGGSISILSGTGVISSSTSGSIVTINVSGSDVKSIMIDPNAQTRWSSIQINFNLALSTDPNITTSTVSLSPFSYVEGNGPSAAQSFTASGINLDNSTVTATAPAGFEISLTGGNDYADSQDISYVGDSFTDQIIYARLKAGESIGSYNGNISISGGGDTTAATKTVEGSVVAPPPANDLCENATELTVNATAVTGNLSGSTSGGADFNDKKDVWYTFNPTYNETYTISVSNYSGDIDVELYGAVCPSDDSEILDNAANGGSAPEVITYTLSQGTTYYVRVLAWDVAAENAFDIQVTAPAPPAPCETPTSQASDLVFGTVDNTSITGSFTAASDADNYLVVISESASLGATPADQTTYTAGNALGNGTVVQVGNSTTFTASGLNPLTTYYVFIFAYNSECLNGPLYNGTSTSASATTIDGPCGEENFDNSNATASYANNSFTGNNGITWTYVASRDENGDSNNSGIDGNALMLRRVSDNSRVISSTISTGIGNFSVKLYKGFTGGGDRQVELFINGISMGTSVAFDDFDEHIFNVNNINIDGDVIIEIRNIQSGQIIIDDITWTCYEAPSEAITWTTDNEWSNGTGPSSTSDDIVIEGTLVTSGDLLAQNLTVADGGSLTIASGNTVTLAGKIVNEAGAENFVVESGANLIQDETYTTNDNEGAITVQRESQDIVRLNYTLWSSPVSGQQIQAFSPMTLPNRIYTYETTAATEATDGEYVVVADVNADFANGKGYLFRAPNDWTTTPAPYAGEFEGVPFNGDVNVDVYAGKYTSIGNPYASNIDADLFLVENTDITSLYFWNNTGVAGSNYATYTSLGGAPAGGGSETPNGIITVGQGFIVESDATSVNFNNEMRTADAGIFFRTNDIEKHRFWLSLNDASNQNLNNILVGYMDGATQGIDNQIDGKQFGYEGSALYSVIDAHKFAVQGRALPFDDTDVVALGFKAAEAGNFNISIANFDGLFAEGQAIVYLKDNQLDIIHNLMESDYSFESTAGEFNQRFEVVYKDEEIMGTDDLNANSIQIYTQNDKIFVNSANEKILSVELYDLSGRKIHSNQKVNANLYQVNSNAKGVLVVKAQTQNGEVATKKVINQ